MLIKTMKTASKADYYFMELSLKKRGNRKLGLNHSKGSYNPAIISFTSNVKVENLRVNYTSDSLVYHQ